jgi:hypothetical protein
MESSTEERKEVYQILIIRTENIKRYSYIPDTLEQYVKIVANNLEVWQIVWLPPPAKSWKTVCYSGQYTLPHEKKILAVSIFVHMSIFPFQILKPADRFSRYLV